MEGRRECGVKHPSCLEALKLQVSGGTYKLQVSGGTYKLRRVWRHSNSKWRSSYLGDVSSPQIPDQPKVMALKFQPASVMAL